MYNSFISFLPQCLSVTRAIFKVPPFSIFTEKNICTVLPFCKFSYLDKFYSFTLAIHLYHFLTECLSVTRANF